MRAAPFALVLWLATAASAQTPGFIAHEGAPVLALVTQANGANDQYQVAYALERFDGALWRELLRSNGQRALIVAGNGIGCWRVPDRSRALGYRLRPQLFAPGALATTSTPINCAAAPFGQPACPNVVNAPNPGGSCGTSFLDVVDPGGAHVWSAPRAPVLRP